MCPEAHHHVQIWWGATSQIIKAYLLSTFAILCLLLCSFLKTHFVRLTYKHFADVLIDYSQQSLLYIRLALSPFTEETERPRGTHRQESTPGTLATLSLPLTSAPPTAESYRCSAGQPLSISILSESTTRKAKQSEPPILLEKNHFFSSFQLIFKGSGDFFFLSSEYC